LYRMGRTNEKGESIKKTPVPSSDVEKVISQKKKIMEMTKDRKIKRRKTKTNKEKRKERTLQDPKTQKSTGK